MYARDRALKVLLVEDNPGDAHLIRRLLTKSSATKHALDAENRLDAGIARCDHKTFFLIARASPPSRRCAPQCHTCRSSC